MTQYVRSRHLQVEQQQADAWVLVHGLLGHRLKVNAATWRFLDLFEQPRSLPELVAEGLAETARRPFEQLVRAGFLVAADHQETPCDKLLQRITPAFFNSPSMAVAEVEGAADVVFLGVPFDYGNHKEPGARYAPAALRRLSADGLFYLLDPATGQPQGWYDNDRDRQILAGVRLADAGNLFVAPNENPQQVFAKLERLTGDLFRSGALPVVIGGDHSITYATVAACPRPVAILQIDAHSDLAPYFPSIENHHGNVMSRALGLAHVQGVYQLGLRGTTAIPQTRVRSRVGLAWSPRRVREAGVAGVLAQLPPELEYYVSLDIDSLDPTCAPGTSTPVPGGFSFSEVKELLVAVAGQRRCAGFDLVEVNPRRDVAEVTVTAALELLLAFLGAHFEARRLPS